MLEMTGVSRSTLLVLAVCSIGLGGCEFSEGDGKKSVRFPITVDAEGRKVSFLFDEPVHEIDVGECAEGCSPSDMDWEYCSFDAWTTVWRTGVGAEEPSGGFIQSGALPPAVDGPVYYGALPAGSDFETPAIPLQEGSVYRVEADVYGPCDIDDNCYHRDRYACAFFKVENAGVVPLSK